MVWIDVLCLWFVALLRCGQLPFASQLGWLGLLRHGTDIGQTQLRVSLLRRESRAAVLPPSSGAARQLLYWDFCANSSPPPFHEKWVNKNSETKESKIMILQQLVSLYSMHLSVQVVSTVVVLPVLTQAIALRSYNFDMLF